MADLTDAASSGDRRATLEALRDVLADSIVQAAPAQRAPLAKQLTDTMRELDGLAKPKGSTVDELKRKRDARRQAGAADPAPSSVGE